jgi:FdhD protein
MVVRKVRFEIKTMKNKQKIPIIRFNTEGVRPAEDMLAVEEPLEIIIGYGTAAKRQHKTIAVTMRTPDHDFDLALGFLFTEGVIASKNDVKSVRFLEDNRVLVDLDEKIAFDSDTLNRHFYTTSSCGVCGKASIEAISTQSCFILQKGSPKISKDVIFKIPLQLIENQLLFEQTGGVHASLLFTYNPTKGAYTATKIFEDVGRHNALDKLIGWAFQNSLLPLKNEILLVSGRASFELIQKAMMAGIPIVAAIGAPSSLAVQLADENGMTLIGFLKQDKFNVYTGIERIK